jgi:hypothetical protein
VGFGALADMGLIRADSAPAATKAFLIVLVAEATLETTMRGGRAWP